MTATLQRPLGDDVAVVEAPPRPRVEALDALRGLAIGLMVFVNLRGSDAMPAFLEHSAWHGFTVADAIFPTFLFALGASLTLSERTRQLGPATTRALKLAIVGSLLSCLQHGILPRPTFGVLQHIAATAVLACLLLRLPLRRQIAVVAGVLALLSLAGMLSGWARSSAWGVHLDEHFFGGFTNEGPQSWLGSVATVWFGVVAGRVALVRVGAERRARLMAWGALLLAAGAALAVVVPVNKPLWTPSYALVGAGVASLCLAALDALVPFTRPARLLGGNAIAAYVVGESALWFVREHVWFPMRGGVEAVVGQADAALLYPTVALAVCFAVCAWLARHGLRLRL